MLFILGGQRRRDGTRLPHFQSPKSPVLGLATTAAAPPFLSGGHIACIFRAVPSGKGASGGIPGNCSITC